MQRCTHKNVFYNAGFYFCPDCQREVDDVTLEDFEFGMDHNYHYGEYTLTPTFGGFEVSRNNSLISDGVVDQNKALGIVRSYLVREVL